MQEPCYCELDYPLGRHVALLPAVIADRLTAETGVDPAALPALPELPRWLTAEAEDRPVMTRDMDTGTLPAIPPAWGPDTVQFDPVPAGDDPAEVPR